MTKITYAEKLRDPRWQRRRLEILERDAWRCRNCGDDTSTLHVHHRFYVGGQEPWEGSNDALVTLCEQCHTDEAELRPGLERELSRFLRTRLTHGQLQRLLDVLGRLPRWALFSLAAGRVSELQMLEGDSRWQEEGDA